MRALNFRGAGDGSREAEFVVDEVVEEGHCRLSMPGVAQDLRGGGGEIVEVEVEVSLVLAETLRRCVRQTRQAIEVEFALATLVGIRNTHGRGRYVERWLDHEGTLAFERESSTLVGLSNRGDQGFDQRTVEVALAPGTHLIELTGNASSGLIDPYDDLAEVLTVSPSQTVDLRIPRTHNADGQEHNQSYVIYGLATPQAASGLEIHGAAGLLSGTTPAANDFANGKTRLSDLHLITADAFEVSLLTNEVRLLGSDDLRDIHADGDQALLKLDGGVDINGNGFVDHAVPSDVSYGFEAFADKSSPLIGADGIDGPRGDGEFRQTIDTTALAEGLHFLEARAFRHRTDAGPAVYSSFQESFYVDRLPPRNGGCPVYAHRGGHQRASRPLPAFGRPDREQYPCIPRFTGRRQRSRNPRPGRGGRRRDRQDRPRPVRLRFPGRGARQSRGDNRHFRTVGQLPYPTHRRCIYRDDSRRRAW